MRSDGGRAGDDAGRRRVVIVGIPVGAPRGEKRGVARDHPTESGIHAPPVRRPSRPFGRSSDRGRRRPCWRTWIAFLSRPAPGGGRGPRPRVALDWSRRNEQHTRRRAGRPSLLGLPRGVGGGAGGRFELLATRIRSALSGCPRGQNDGALPRRHACALCGRRWGQHTITPLGTRYETHANHLLSGVPGTMLTARARPVARATRRRLAGGRTEPG